METFALLMVLGVRVREVRDLEEGHIWLPDDLLLFIDLSLHRADREVLASLLIAEAAGEC